MTTLLSLFDAHAGYAGNHTGTGNAAPASAGDNAASVVEFTKVSSFLDIASLLSFGKACRHSYRLAKRAGERRVQEFFDLYEDFADPEALNYMASIVGWQRQLRWGTTHPIKILRFDRDCVRFFRLENGNIAMIPGDVTHTRVIIVSGRTGATVSELAIDVSGSTFYSAGYFLLSQFSADAQLWKVGGDCEFLEFQKSFHLPQPGGWWMVAKDIPVRYNVKLYERSIRLIERNFVTNQERTLEIPASLDYWDHTDMEIVVLEKHLLLVAADRIGSQNAVAAFSIHRETMVLCHAQSITFTNPCGRDRQLMLQRTTLRGCVLVFPTPPDESTDKVKISLDSATGLISSRTLNLPISARWPDQMINETNMVGMSTAWLLVEYDTWMGRRLRGFPGALRLLWIDEETQTIAAKMRGANVSFYSIKTEQRFVGDV